VKGPSRRNFLVCAGAGAAAVGAAVFAPEAAAAPVRAPAGASGPLVAYVTDMRAGELTLMVGEREIVVHDPDLAARLARAAH
jgi:Ubiquitinol-cytochrome C reductase Fe-S subunit TAT signal